MSIALSLFHLWRSDLTLQSPVPLGHAAIAEDEQVYAKRISATGDPATLCEDIDKGKIGNASTADKQSA